MSEMQMHFAHFAIRNGDGVFYKHCGYAAGPAVTRRSGHARELSETF
jgi:hypothetical protein